MSLSRKAVELRDLSHKRNYSKNLHDYFTVLLDNDDNVQKILDYLYKNIDATEDEIFEEINRISPPPEIVIVNDDNTEISDLDTKIINKIKPELKRLNMDKTQKLAIFVAIQKNPKKLDDCFKLLSEATNDIDKDLLISSIIEICFN